jgi:hypothetical protein
VDSATLGKLKLENKFKEGIFVMPKVYFLELGDGKCIMKCKGYSGKLHLIILLIEVVDNLTFLANKLF